MGMFCCAPEPALLCCSNLFYWLISSPRSIAVLGFLRFSLIVFLTLWAKSDNGNLWSFSNQKMQLWFWGLSFFSFVSYVWGNFDVGSFLLCPWASSTVLIHSIYCYLNLFSLICSSHHDAALMLKIDDLSHIMMLLWCWEFLLFLCVSHIMKHLWWWECSATVPLGQLCCVVDVFNWFLVQEALLC